MIIVRIFGGLGNQLFQYAAGKALATHYNVNLKLDLRWLSRYHTGFQLNGFSITADVTSVMENSIYTWFPFKRNPFYYYIKAIKNINKHIYFENDYFYDANFFNQGPNKFLFGYFQSEKYFSDYKDIIHTEFKYIPDYSLYKKQVIDAVLDTNSTAIQFRRGDYITDINANRTMGTCSLDYYKRAIKYIKNKQTKSQFIIFSDDIAWCRKNVSIDNAVYVERKGGLVLNDLAIASQCKNIILANSTFSWWSAWLNSNKDKIVIAPKRWFKDKNLQDKSYDLFSNDWILL